MVLTICKDPDGLNYLSPSYLSKVAARFAKKEKIKTDEFTVLELKPFYGANKYYLFVKTVYKDIRMVGAPPSSIGKFGADTDNWMCRQERKACQLQCNQCSSESEETYRNQPERSERG